MQFAVLIRFVSEKVLGRTTTPPESESEAAGHRKKVSLVFMHAKAEDDDSLRSLSGWLSVCATDVFNDSKILP